MSRKRRLYGDSGIYHVILRGNNKQNLFNFDSDKKFVSVKPAPAKQISLKSFRRRQVYEIRFFTYKNNYQTRNYKYACIKGSTS